MRAAGAACDPSGAAATTTAPRFILSFSSAAQEDMAIAPRTAHLLRRARGCYRSDQAAPLLLHPASNRSYRDPHGASLRALLFHIVCELRRLRMMCAVPSAWIGVEILPWRVACGGCDVLRLKICDQVNFTRPRGRGYGTSSMRSDRPRA